MSDIYSIHFQFSLYFAFSNVTDYDNLYSPA